MEVPGHRDLNPERFSRGQPKLGEGGAISQKRDDLFPAVPNEKGVRIPPGRGINRQNSPPKENRFPLRKRKATRTRTPDTRKNRMADLVSGGLPPGICIHRGKFHSRRGNTADPAEP